MRKLMLLVLIFITLFSTSAVSAESFDYQGTIEITVVDELLGFEIIRDTSSSYVYKGPVFKSFSSIGNPVGEQEVLSDFIKVSNIGNVDMDVHAKITNWSGDYTLVSDAPLSNEIVVVDAYYMNVLSEVDKKILSDMRPGSYDYSSISAYLGKASTSGSFSFTIVYTVSKS